MTTGDILEALETRFRLSLFDYFGPHSLVVLSLVALIRLVLEFYTPKIVVPSWVISILFRTHISIPSEYKTSVSLPVPTTFHP